MDSPRIYRLLAGDDQVKAPFNIAHPTTGRSRQPGKYRTVLDPGAADGQQVRMVLSSLVGFIMLLYEIWRSSSISSPV